jgi:ribosomal protein S18 acetylase RimI-like enzyme
MVSDRGVRTEPGGNGPARAVDALREWQDDAAPFQLHPGDLGWFWRFGASATADAVRSWGGDDELLAVGLLDGPEVVRLAITPSAQQDEDLAQRLVDDLGRHAGSVEVPNGALVRELLSAAGWQLDEAWTPLRRDLTEPVEDPGVRIEVIGPDRAAVRAAVHRASFDRSSFTADRWQAMAAGPAFAGARDLVAYDGEGDAVAGITVWSAGPGRPGLIEPMGVHREHRGHGYGTAITVAGAAALREMGSSSATVCTPSANVGGVATYEAAGFRRLPQRRDLRRG